MKNEKGLKIYYLATISAAVLWGASFIATKLAYETFAPIQVGAARTLLAVVVFWMIRTIKKDRQVIRKEDRLRIAASGFLGTTLYFTVQNIGVGMTSASNSALIVASFPAMTMLLEFLIYHTKQPLKKLAGIFISITGVAILSQVTLGGDSTTIWGNILIVAAGVIWVFYNFLTRSVLDKYSPMTITYYQMLAGAILFVPFVIAEGGQWSMPAPLAMGALLYLGVGCSFIAFLLYNFGLKKLSPSASVSLMNLIPVVGLILSILILKESISVVQLFGGAIVIAGVALSSNQ